MKRPAAKAGAAGGRMSSGQVSHVRAGLALSGARALSSPEEVFRVLAAQTPVGVFVSSEEGKCEYVNQRWCELTGLAPEEALGDGWVKALHPDDIERVVEGWQAAAAAGRDSVSEYRFLRPDGTVSWIEGYAKALRDEDGAIVGWVGTCLDLTARRAAEEAVVAASERFRAAFDNAPIGMGLVAPEGRLIEVNTALCRLLGYTEEDLLSINLADLTIPGDPTAQAEVGAEGSRETRYLRADGSRVWVAASATLVRDAEGKPLYHVVQIEDISNRKETEYELRRLADHDPLTGLLNRRGFLDGLRRELRRMERNHEYGALLLLDLDNFKVVNDSAGHPAGDQVLRRTADVLRHRLRATDVIGRLGGDEFAALILNVTLRQAQEIADETAEAVAAQTLTAGDVTVEVSASIGVVAIEETSEQNEDDLIAAVDRAMYQAKSLRQAR